MQYFDLHTHQLKKTEDIQILNIFAQDLPPAEPDYLFSAGLHPWHIGKVNLTECFHAIERAAEQKNMLAIGECGLDRSIKIGFADQILCFRQQVMIANKYCKPLIIHCVRAYSDLLKLKKEDKSDLPWIIHGYNGNLETTLNLIKHGFYFSVGEQLLRNASKHEVLRLIPLEHMFFETDESEWSITKIYSMAAQVLRLSESELIQSIARNFVSVFGY